MKSPSVERFNELSLSREPTHSDAGSLSGSSTPKATQRIIYVVDDNAELRQSLEFLLATRNMIVQSFESGHAFFDAVDGLAPAPIILDMRMPRMNGIEFQEELSQRKLAWPVIILTGHGEVGIAVKGLKLGAIDFLEKPVEVHELEKCLKRAYQTLESEQDAEQSKAATMHLLSRLTPRESEVLTALCSGQSNKQVAFSLSISPRTVEMHRAKALRQLEVRSIAEVVTLMNRSSNRKRL